jgi:hypothetical protein
MTPIPFFAILQTGSAVDGWSLLVNLLGLTLFAAALVATVPVIRQDSDSEKGLVAALAATAALVPITVAEAGTVIAFIAPQSALPSWAHTIRDLALALGTFSALVAWFAVSWFYRHFATAKRQNSEVYAELCQRYAGLQTQVATWCGDSDAEDPIVQASSRAAREHCTAIAAELGIDPAAESKGLRWVLATGYINVWKRVHRAEEALIVVLPSDMVVAGAVYDDMRLQSSKMPNRDQLQTKLRYAVHALNPGMVGMLTSAGGTATPPFPSDMNLSEMEARGVLRYVRLVIDEYRDARWDGLVRERNHLLETVIFTRITAFTLLALTILNRVPSHTILAVAVFFLIGASTGFFHRLGPGSSGNQTPLEDYGLFSATLVQTPLFSGLAGVGGVLLTSMMAVALNKVAPTPQATSQVVPQLADILDISKYQFGLIIAALFGLTPQLLINRLQSLANQYKSELGSTQASASKE